MDKIDVLDHGFVRLVDSMGGDLSVIRAARVSYDAAWRAGEDQGSDKRLINYLLKFLTLRCDAHAQYEIRVYADAMRDLARAVAPVCIEAWEGAAAVKSAA